MYSGRVNATFFVLLTAIAVSGEISFAQTTQQRKVERVIRNDEWHMIWARGMKEEPDIFIQPLSLAISGDHLLVLDEGTREITVIDMRTARLVNGLEARNGSGPGEMRIPSLLAAAPGGLAVYDAGNSRVSAFNFDGTLLWDAPVGNSTPGLCIPNAGSYLVIAAGNGSAEIRDTTGTLLRSIPLPWAAASQSTLANGVKVVGPGTHGECVIARTFGSHFAVVRQPGTITAYHYIEPMPEPVIESRATTLSSSSKSSLRQVTSSTRSTPSGAGATLVGDTLIVRFLGNTEHAGFLLDYYLITDGRYLFSRLLPPGIIAVAAASDGTFYATMIGEDHAGVLAMKPHPSQDPRLKPHKLVEPGKAGKTKRAR